MDKETRDQTRTVLILAGISFIFLLIIGILAYTLENHEHYETKQIAKFLADHEPTLLEAPDTPFLESEEAIIISDAEDDGQTILPLKKALFEYIEVVDGCGPYMEEECLNVRAEPSTTSPIVHRLRTGAILKIGGIVEYEGETWFKIVFDEWLRYPERITTDWYVNADYVEVLFNEGTKHLDEDIATASTSKRIIIDRSDQRLYAYDGDTLFMEEPISTGIELTPTPRGVFTIFRKTPSRYMQGPIPGISTKYYDLPGVPWNLYFTEQGAVIHGAYWHDQFGKPYSNGCVNLPPEKAKELYYWADIGTKVTVQD